VPESTYIRWASDQLNAVDPVIRRAWAGDNSTVFEITVGNERYFLKIGDRLARESAGLGWLRDRLPVPQVVAFEQLDGIDALLMTAVPGANLARLVKSQPAASIVEMLASTLRAFHSASTENCPFGAYIPGKTLVHGDACLPNIMVDDNGLGGYIDLVEMGVGGVEVDRLWTMYATRSA
jgi:aminoglycoside phosphotransferase